MGDRFGIYNRGILLRLSSTVASIDFKCVSYNDLAVNRVVLG